MGLPAAEWDENLLVGCGKIDFTPSKSPTEVPARSRVLAL
jgi:hypothetical protein